MRVLSRKKNLPPESRRLAYSEGEILGGKDAAEVLFIVHNKDTVGSLSGTELTGVSDRDGLGHRQGGQRSQGGHGAGLVLLSLRPLSSGRRSGSFASWSSLDEIVFNLPSEGLLVLLNSR